MNDNDGTSDQRILQRLILARAIIQALNQDADADGDADLMKRIANGFVEGAAILQRETTDLSDW